MTRPDRANARDGDVRRWLLPLAVGFDHRGVLVPAPAPTAMAPHVEATGTTAVVPESHEEEEHAATF